MKRIIPIAFLAALAAIAWHVGGMIPAHTMTLFFGFLFGAFVGIPAMLIIATRAQTVRHDHYVHTPREAPTQQQPRLEQENRAKPLSGVYFVNIDDEELLISGKELSETLVAMADKKIQLRRQPRYTVVDDAVKTSGSARSRLEVKQ